MALAAIDTGCHGGGCCGKKLLGCGLAPESRLADCVRDNKWLLPEEKPTAGGQAK